MKQAICSLFLNCPHNIKKVHTHASYGLDLNDSDLFSPVLCGGDVVSSLANGVEPSAKLVSESQSAAEVTTPSSSFLSSLPGSSGKTHAVSPLSDLKASRNIIQFAEHCISKVL